jgi:hypothetical protein
MADSFVAGIEPSGDDGMREGLIQLVEAIAALGALAGGFFVFTAISGEASAPQQGALAAVGVGFAVVPYCIASIMHRGAIRSAAKRDVSRP